MQPPVTYQGGKSRIADIIVRTMNVPRDAPFVDLCCGSGAIAIRAIADGRDPRTVTMVDVGPWGLVWAAVADGAFDMQAFGAIVDEVPMRPEGVKGHIERLFESAPDETAPYVFLLLQASAIGGAPIWIADGKWRRSSGFRDYWQPTATSSRRSPVNPMMPMPATIVSRMSVLVERMRGVRALHVDAASIEAQPGAVAYIDPPYVGTTKYPFAIDALEVAGRYGQAWVSEGRPLGPGAIRISIGRTKGGMTGDRKVAASEEWLTPLPNNQPYVKDSP